MRVRVWPGCSSAIAGFVTLLSTCAEAAQRIQRSSCASSPGRPRGPKLGRQNLILGFRCRGHVPRRLAPLHCRTASGGAPRAATGTPFAARSASSTPTTFVRRRDVWCTNHSADLVLNLRGQGSGCISSSPGTTPQRRGRPLHLPQRRLGAESSEKRKARDVARATAQAARRQAAAAAAAMQ